MEQTGIEWLEEMFKKHYGKDFVELNQQRFDKAKQIDSDFIEKLKDFDTWKEWKNEPIKTNKDEDSN